MTQNCSIRYRILFALWIVLTHGVGMLYCQSSATYWDWAGFRSVVLQQHPTARQADLLIQQARAELLRARGGFDPKVYGDWSGKHFNGKQYFQYSEVGIKAPTWLGIELKSNFNRAAGDFVNPEAALPQRGQFAAGLNWTLGQGLFIDDRRADLQIAQIGLDQRRAERAAMLNEILFEAAKVYWDWTFAQNALSIYQEALRQARIRYEGIVESFYQGDKPAIDTLEAFIQVQNRQLDVNFARVDLQNATIALTTFLWGPNGDPAGLSGIPAPPEVLMAATYQPPTDAVAQELLRQAQNQHPLLRAYDAKLRALEVERRLKLERRKPQLDLNYQLLGNGWQFFTTPGVEGPQVLANDIKWGIQFSYPILNRKARGDWQVTQIKIAQNNLELAQKRLEIENKTLQYLNELNTLANQVALYRDITNNYRTLLDGEYEKFRFGESSVFLINTREQRWLDAQIKYLKLMATYRKTEAGLLWSAGVLAQ
ncbi:MAG: TolC family protein [Saprospiraceae bacterium]|nr:TolC family protein [Saprospiraceae bacterium]MDW8229087.1 TolC family protein [Saprospiraceae bacterium]